MVKALLPFIFCLLWHFDASAQANTAGSGLSEVRPAFAKYKLIAHRGGIVEGRFNEYDPRSIKAAIDSGYWMLEIDVRPTRDHQLVVHHDNDLERIYGVSGRVENLTLSELRSLKAMKGDYHPMTFEEVLQMMKGKVRIMVDLKPSDPAPWFNRSVNELLKKYGMLEDALFLRNDVMSFYDGGRFGFRMSEIDRIKALVANHDPVIKRYYLFDHGNRINAEAARWCQKNNIPVCTSINFGHYKLEDPYKGAKRDAGYQVQCGIIMHQIDSDFDDFFLD